MLMLPFFQKFLPDALANTGLDCYTEYYEKPGAARISPGKRENPI